ncbi:hypothetical protein QWA_10304 [Alcaligenes faecalis subsp. faecalis NCIB 8687]|uniref:hypothetical protein n=1 Tax=Alcaligenes faecalis TaxID=511 RepID=UPI000269EAC2|nr:hypothetical protein [Alcaligenes faecalis]EJC62452.1 hypothetical protein QWA_10304 [Alcaligenes faecalis subsp. faecalis NCIB 8687]RSE63658.1 hypothetical protein EGT81_05005 [Alcaligenes faecalis]
MTQADPVQAMFERMGGTQLQAQFAQHKTQIAPRKALPHAKEDVYSYSYCILVGGLAAVADGLLDYLFRSDMQQTHRELGPEEQQALEIKVNDYLKEQGLKPDSGPTMGMDYYADLNEQLNLRNGFKLRPANHRILNHADRDSVIGMLMRGEAGFGGTIDGLFPTMSLEQATKLYDLHIAADRGTPQSLPLKFMSWLWEQGVKSGDSTIAGDSSLIFKFLQKLAPEGDWAGWINKFCEGNPIKPPATLGEAMLKLYDLGILNERVFWTSNLGAAVGGFKRRLIITALMELAVEVYAIFEGTRLGYIQWQGSPADLARGIMHWRDQPKYVDMKIMIQCIASSYGIIRTLVVQDPLSLNLTSIAMVAKHLIFHPAMIDRHYIRLAAFSREDVQVIDASFMARTGIQLPSFESKESNDMHPFDKRIIDLGCFSTRVRVLGSRYQERMTSLIERMERLAPLAENNNTAMEAFDSLCDTWYLGEVEDDQAALKQFEADVSEAERKIALSMAK